MRTSCRWPLTSEGPATTDRISRRCANICPLNHFGFARRGRSVLWPRSRHRRGSSRDRAGHRDVCRCGTRKGRWRRADLEGGGSELLFDSDAAVFGDFLLNDPIRALGCLWRFKAIEETRARTLRRLFGGPLLRYLLPTAVLDLRHRIAQRSKSRERQRDLPWAGPRLKAFLDARRTYPSRAPILSQRDRVRGLASSELLMSMREHASRWEIGSGLPTLPLSRR